jgi:hypothetical protein
MSQSKTKKFRKEVRRVVDANFGIGMEALSNITRPRPRWCPKVVWMLAYVPLFKKQCLHLIYKHMK